MCKTLKNVNMREDIPMKTDAFQLVETQTQEY